MSFDPHAVYRREAAAVRVANDAWKDRLPEATAVALGSEQESSEKTERAWAMA